MLLKPDFGSLNRGCKLENLEITVHFWKKSMLPQAASKFDISLLYT